MSSRWRKPIRRVDPSATMCTEGKSVDNVAIKALIASQPERCALQRAFYYDPDIYQREIQRIFMRSWLYAGHVSLIPQEGDFFVFEIDNESVIIVRSTADTVSALLNVCRHRGSRVCLEEAGKTRSFTCRYHGWTYGLDGRLKAAGHMDPAFDKSRYPLKPIHVELLHGLIFISFAAAPPKFAAIADDLGAPLTPYDLGHAKVAERRNYTIDANWKLTVENYCECYHCAPAHPEYTVAHGRALQPEKITGEFERVQREAARIGLTDHQIRRSWLDAGEVGVDRGFERYPLLHGHLSGTRDGKPVAPLLGKLTGYSGGAVDIHLGPVTFALAYDDHLVVYRFTPRSQFRTDCEVTWLVHETATAGKDYQLDELVWLWDVTTVADKAIIERNQAGVSSRFYEPGPLSLMEDFTARFLLWYLTVIA